MSLHARLGTAAIANAVDHVTGARFEYLDAFRWLCLKSRPRAPKARNMKARGKREAQRNASPLV